uniref:N-alpha-acetyltransferase 40 n=1 Tax=Parascaris univalens TaxID=6257 RepID=A0A915CAB2_PARUN
MARSDLKKRLVKKANKMLNPVETLKCPIPTQTLSGEPLSFSFLWGTHLDDTLFQWVFKLFVENMRSFYEMSLWGYDETSKKQELTATTSRYIIVRNMNDTPIAYCHYRFDMDHDSAVVYCFEIQVEEKYQSQGIGTIMISMLESLGQKTSMEKIMATVFAFNHKSLGFFHKVGFITDPTCPTADDQLDYLILSKSCA